MKGQMRRGRGRGSSFSFLAISFPEQNNSSDSSGLANQESVSMRFDLMAEKLMFIAEKSGDKSPWEIANVLIVKFPLWPYHVSRKTDT